MLASPKLHLHVHFTHCIQCNSYDLVLFWLINIQLHLRVAYKMVWLSHGNEDEWIGL